MQIQYKTSFKIQEEGGAGRKDLGNMKNRAS